MELNERIECMVFEGTYTQFDLADVYIMGCKLSEAIDQLGTYEREFRDMQLMEEMMT